MTAHRLFPLEADDVGSANVALSQHELSKLWHRRYGHLKNTNLQQLSQKELMLGLPHILPTGVCEGCLFGKQTKHHFPKGQAKRATAPIELVHADLCGPMQTQSLGGNSYFVLLTDDYSCYSWVYFLQSKSEALDRFKIFKQLAEK